MPAPNTAKRIGVLETIEKRRNDTAIKRALDALTPAESDLFWSYWRRSHGHDDVWPTEDEAPAVNRYCELVNRIYDEDRYAHA